MDSPSLDARRPVYRRALAIAAAAALGLGAALAATAPASAAPSAGTIDDATLTWGLNGESGGGAYFGGCNFLSAGTAGNTGSSRVWTEADGFYATTAGNVTIKKPDSSGALQNASWATKCLDPSGKAVSAASTTSLTGNVAVITGGSGSVASDGSRQISWTGSFTIAFYGGMTYWTAANPVLTLDASGNGQLTATASGYGTSMEDMSQWVPISPRSIVLATVHGASVTDSGLTVTPDYLGVAVNTGSGTAQSTTGAAWGSFPQNFVDFQALTGQSSYWYSSGGSRDAAKPTTPLTVSYTTSTGGTDPSAGDSQDIGVTVPSAEQPPSGEFGWSFASTSAVDLGTAKQAGNTFTASGNLNRITVTDTRTGGSTPYTWSISGQVSDFASSAGSFSGGYLGWTPAVSNAGTGVTAGAAVTSTAVGGTGLASPATLASSTAAAGADIDAGLSLVIPSSTKAGKYTATLTITALS